MSRPTVLALDLEGTLISNAYSQIPRPGLRAFLAASAELAPRIVVFTTVPEPVFRTIAVNLVARGESPTWFPDTEYIAWPGPKKDLALVPDVNASAVRIVDDDPERFAVPDQLASWVTIAHFAPPYSEHDTGFETVLAVLKGHFK